MSVAQAQREIDSQEFASWLAYDRISPFGEERADLRSAIVAATLANANRGKGTKPFTTADFMPRWDAVTEVQTPEEMLSRLATHAVAHNGKAKG
jgi:hypothetical protein